jgi:hypothetical protein
VAPQFLSGSHIVIPAHKIGAAFSTGRLDGILRTNLSSTTLDPEYLRIRNYNYPPKVVKLGSPGTLPCFLGLL